MARATSTLGVLTTAAPLSTAYHPILGQGRRLAILKLDWNILDITGVPSVTITCAGKCSTSDVYANLRDENGVLAAFDETDFGSPVVVGLHSVYIEIVMTPDIIVSITNSNAATNTVTAILME